MTDLETTYVTEPDIPPGMTIAEYRQSRPTRVAWWKSLGRRGARPRRP
jgi:hypothetical protein